MEDNQLNFKDMALAMMNIKSHSIEMINTVHVKDQPYAEISKTFALRWNNYLEHTWHLIDANGQHHMVTYNKNQQNPAITTGWTAIRDHYNLEGNHQITLIHYAQSVFLITVYKSPSEPQSFPKWHSLYKQNPNSIVFRLMLNENKIKWSFLDLPTAMYHFLNENEFTYIDFDGKIQCKLVYNHWRNNVKIGRGWKTFVAQNQLKPNLEFIMEFPDPTHNILLWYTC